MGISSTIDLFIYHLQMPNGNQRSVYDHFVYLPSADAEWESEVRGFLENYEFPRVGAWDGLHVYISSKLKIFFSFKKRYTMTNLDLVGYNKRFLYAALGAPGSPHDARLLKGSSIFNKILKGDVLPDRVISLGDFGYVPLVTVGDSVFPQFSWLIKFVTKVFFSDNVE